MKQLQATVEYFIQTGNKPLHYSIISNDLNILIPNMRRILGQGTLKGIFKRVSSGTYKFNI